MERNEKIQRIVIIAIVCAAILIISLIAYLRNTTNSGQEISYEESQDSLLESTSTQMGKTIDEVEEEYETAELVTSDDTNITTSKSTNTVSSENETSNSTANIENESTENEVEVEKIEETESNEVVFESPIKGEILREFAKDSLVYSNTLKEWITHNGIDIKADKTSVVAAAANGTVYAIKNDPRYGLTVIINHDNGYQTVYSNLLTAEFIVEGEEVEKGQSIGTVGNSASFEILDDCHLHFELLKDNEYLDPTIYMSFE